MSTFLRTRCVKTNNTNVYRFAVTFSFSHINQTLFSLPLKKFTSNLPIMGVPKTLHANTIVALNANLNIRQYDICNTEYHILYDIYATVKDPHIRSQLCTALWLLWNNFFKVRTGYSTMECQNTYEGRITLLRRLFRMVNVLPVNIPFQEIVKSTETHRMVQTMLDTTRENWIYTIDGVLFYGRY